MSLSVVLLAAGEGKRMKTSQPKPLVMLGDMPLVQHSLNTIKKLKPSQVFLVTGHKKDEVKKYVLENNAKVLLVSHLGRPIEGNFDEKLICELSFMIVSNKEPDFKLQISDITIN